MSDIKTMELSLFKTLWGHDGSLDEAVTACLEAGFAGIEAPAPLDQTERKTFFATLEKAGLEWIAEISTCTPPGTYVPEPDRSVEDHLASLEAGVRIALKGSPIFINTMAGYDAWPVSEAIRLFRGVVELEQKHGIAITVETHRGRPTFTPWATREILDAVPELKITCDFSHWCVVTERFILDDLPDLLSLVARHAHHIQPRVGYAQGPQVPDPRAPEHADALAAHLRWWDAVWDSMRDRGFGRVTMTPEFGPAGYLQCAPFTRTPAADLWEVNRWIAHHLSDRFHRRTSPLQAC